MNVIDATLGFIVGIISAILAGAYFLRSNELSYKTHFAHFVIIHNLLGAFTFGITAILFFDPLQITWGRCCVVSFAFIYLWYTKGDNRPFYSAPTYMESHREHRDTIHVDAK